MPPSPRHTSLYTSIAIKFHIPVHILPLLGGYELLELQTDKVHRRQMQLNHFQSLSKSDQIGPLIWWYTSNDQITRLLAFTVLDEKSKHIRKVYRTVSHGRVFKGNYASIL